jgi:uncharacterized protein (TIGR04222 family)
MLNSVKTDLYRHFFGSPPKDIWSPPDLRFGEELKMQRVNLSSNWVIPKLFPELPLTRLVGILAMATMITIMTMSHVHAATAGSLQTGWSTTYDQLITIFLLSIILGLLLRYAIRLPIKQLHKPELDIYQIAYLAGGYQRAIELAIVQLVHQGYLLPNVHYRTFSIEKLPTGATPLQQQVMRQVRHTPDFKNLRELEKYETDFFQQQLQQEKLLMKGWPLLIGSSWVILVSITGLGVFLLSVAQIFLGQLPMSEILYKTGSLPWLVVFTFTLCCFVPSAKTLWGSRILADLKKNYDAYDVNQRFALYGYSVLSGGVLDDLRQVFSAQAQVDSEEG